MGERGGSWGTLSETRHTTESWIWRWRCWRRRPGTRMGSQRRRKAGCESSDLVCAATSICSNPLRVAGLGAARATATRAVPPWPRASAPPARAPTQRRTPPARARCVALGGRVAKRGVSCRNGSPSKRQSGRVNTWGGGQLSVAVTQGLRRLWRSVAAAVPCGNPSGAREPYPHETLQTAAIGLLRTHALLRLDRLRPPQALRQALGGRRGPRPHSEGRTPRELGGLGPWQMDRWLVATPSPSANAKGQPHNHPVHGASLWRRSTVPRTGCRRCVPASVSACLASIACAGKRIARQPS